LAADAEKITILLSLNPKPCFTGSFAAAFAPRCPGCRQTVSSSSRAGFLTLNGQQLGNEVVKPPGQKVLACCCCWNETERTRYRTLLKGRQVNNFWLFCKSTVLPLFRFTTCKVQFDRNVCIMMWQSFSEQLVRVWMNESPQACQKSVSQ
jgi:hypothetical protein